MSIIERPAWKPESTESADLVRGYRIARQLQRLPIPPMLAKQVASFLFRADAELAARDIDITSLTRQDES
jgi:hypothetical protein